MQQQQVRISILTVIGWDILEETASFLTTDPKRKTVAAVARDKTRIITHLDQDRNEPMLRPTSKKKTLTPNYSDSEKLSESSIMFKTRAT